LGAIEKIRSEDRITVRRAGEPNAEGNCVVYWMQHAQRAEDNPALDVAIRIANELGKPVVAFFGPVPFYPNANLRHYRFLAAGVPDVASGLESRNVGFAFRPYPNHSLLKFCEEARPCMVISDEDPLREAEHWRVKAMQLLRVPFWTVDANVVVPSKLLLKEQFAARTIRPRIQKLLPQFLLPGKKVVARVRWKSGAHPRFSGDSDNFLAEWKLSRSVSPVPMRSGTSEALRALSQFVRNGLRKYPDEHNHPEVNGTSHLSPYLHFGQLSPIRVALAVQKAKVPGRAKEAFLEQLIVRRELAINFVKYNPAYDSADCLEPWAERTLSEHARDKRPILYTEAQLENAETHDPLWNAAQKQMVITGWMHNYLRMYWAKKTLEWSPSIATAYQRAVTLNDRYELDGRDPNGYAGIAWAVVGKHDRAWSDRPIYGKIRYMSYASTSRKFDSKKYIAQIAALERS
jgi:deoxyribodipyrimidine photo-lyase